MWPKPWAWSPSSKQPEQKLSPRERLEHFQGHPHPLHQPLPPGGAQKANPCALTYYPVDDYLTCPFKYKIAHLLGLKPPPDQSLMYGNAFHTAIQAYHKARMDGQSFSWDATLEAFLAVWRGEGFDSPEHEQERKEKGIQQLLGSLLR